MISMNHSVAPRKEGEIARIGDMIKGFLFYLSFGSLYSIFKNSNICFSVYKSAWMKTLITGGYLDHGRAPKHLSIEWKLGAIRVGMYAAFEASKFPLKIYVVISEYK